MACRGAGRSDEFGQVPPRDENSEARRDVVAHQMVVHRDALEIFGLAKEEHPQDAAHPKWFLKPTRDFPLELLRQVAARQGHPADLVRQAEAELPDAAQMAQLQVLLEPQARRLRELPQVSQRQVLEKLDVRVDEHSALKTPAQMRMARLQDASPGFQESHWAPRASQPREK